MIIQGMFLPESSCSTFRRNPDGTWTSISPITIFGYGGLIEIRPGMTFNKGVLFRGMDLAAWLDENCP